MSSADEMDSPVKSEPRDASVEDEEIKNSPVEAEEESGNDKFDPLSKEDLSDVSDLESHDGLQESNNKASPHKTMQDQLETELDFEAEEKDEEPKKQELSKRDKSSSAKNAERADSKPEAGEIKDDENDLEEGECTDGEDARPEEESKPVCRFYNRGQCTWGANCRFVHPGVTDKGNYTMFDMVRPLVPTNGPPGFDVPYDRPYGSGLGSGEPFDGPPLESAWERGLRHAKEMMKKATRRKETDMDFEEKKMNLGLGQEDLDKENDFYTRPASPIHRFEENDERYGRPSRDDDYYAQDGWKRSQDVSRRQLENFYKQRQNREFRESMRGKGERSSRRSRDASSSPESSKGHHSASKYKDKERVKGQPKQKPDDWSDPWMRQKSPTRKGTWKRSHSSESSYSSSSGSSTGSSSSSHSRFSGHSPAPKKSAVEANVYRSSKYETSAPPKPKEPREPPVTKKRQPVDELMLKKGFKSERGKKRHHRSSSGSGSSSASNSSISSSSDDERLPPKERRAETVTKIKAMDALKMSGQKQQIRLTLRDSEAPPKAESAAKKRPVEPPAPTVEAKTGGKKPASRREELLKQLKAVEDAIKRKKAKTN
ncbi:zinc finger CCCH domain-containing protein 18 isoform X2 [Neocloeon triangulifer]|uniref:zinc finger CCCH domain-containing protein 18 isoform X2 n=1 Tax=Neocloeon triangulifer TaxID=2078957 RepID=UPI00286ECA1B|nr:zinc finger CCCH domain-containing protein 18 isoform X2 [Neocloeon triangulifer]